jgi:hypothetical protein
LDGKSRMDMLDWAAENFSPSPDPAIPDGQTSSPTDPTLPPRSTKRRLNPLFVEALMRWPTGLSGFDTAAMDVTLWQSAMRMQLSTLCNARRATQPQAGLFDE